MQAEAPILTKLYVAIQDFREAMEGNVRLNEFDQRCLENYIAMLELTYIEWKRRNDPPAEDKRVA